MFPSWPSVGSIKVCVTLFFIIYLRGYRAFRSLCNYFHGRHVTLLLLVVLRVCLTLVSIYYIRSKKKPLCELCVFYLCKVCRESWHKVLRPARGSLFVFSMACPCRDSYKTCLLWFQHYPCCRVCDSHFHALHCWLQLRLC